jgi:ubiquinone/menaquinone biosynthesis C-methylase UbiE
LSRTRFPSALPPCGLFAAVLFILSLQTTWGLSDDVRDKYHQPHKVMDIAGIKSGMIIGEVGAGSGYFTFHLARRVGAAGKIYANDISQRALRSLRAKAEREGIAHIETILGEVEDPLLPSGLDAVFIVNAFHDLAEPVALLNNLAPCLKPQAKVVILDRDPAKFRIHSDHNYSKEKVLELVDQSLFELDRLETFLPQHNIYVIKLKEKLTFAPTLGGIVFF